MCPTSRMLPIAGALLLATGCVSTKYKPAPKETPPPALINLAAESPPLAAVLHTVIIFKGPGSWKQEAYWDEYVVSVHNTGDAPVALESAMLFDLAGHAQAPGTNPWELDRHGREQARALKRSNKMFLIGAGMTAAWLGSGTVAALGLVGGSATAGVVGAAGFVAIPAWVLGVGVRSLMLRADIGNEFDRRRLALPLTLAPGQKRSGSLFFPITPGPPRLVLRYRHGDHAEGITFVLTPLAGLHLRPAAGN